MIGLRDIRMNLGTDAYRVQQMILGEGWVLPATRAARVEPSVALRAD